MPTKDEVERLAALFQGNEDYHGYHGEPVRDEDAGKWSIRNSARTVRAPVTLTMWELHVRGERPLGVAPTMMVDQCCWGSIDIDDYSVDAVALVLRVESMGYPLVACRSKSGGIHLFMFLREPESAASVQTVLRDMAASLGHAGAEVFPKQSRLLTERGDQPNWIVMPYFGGDFGGKLRRQHGLKKTGNEMTLGEFLRAAEAARTTTNEVKVRRRNAPRQRAAGGGDAAVPDVPFANGPVCLQYMAANGGVQRGGQNNALFMMGVYYRRAYPETWKEHLEHANSTLLDPPGTAEGLMGVIRSLERNQEYHYTCKKTPMVNHCNSPLCRTREFGVGEAGNFPVITSISRLDVEPVQWFVEVEGNRLSMRTPQLMDYRLFSQMCVEAASLIYAPMKDGDWRALLKEAFRNLTPLPLIPDVGLGAEFMELLTTFLTDRARAKRPEELVGGKPWEDVDGQWGERGAFYFPLSTLMDFLKKRGEWDRQRVDERVKKMGGEHVFKNIKGSGRHLRKLPGSLIPRPTVLETPRAPEDKI